jgi:Peptidase family M28
MEISEGPSRRAFLSASAAAIALPVIGTPTAHAAQIEPASQSGPGHPTTPQPPEQELQDALREISPARIEAIIQRLVAFGTRHTLSSQDDPVRGIGAARDWIHEQMQGFAAVSGGRMTVELQSYVQQPSLPRIPVATRITNVVATLRGDTEPNRVYVVTGHYDSRVTDVLDFTSDAPGADDDASGVAAIMEMARVMATRRTRATIMFVAVAGEEQGLFGSTFLASQLKAAGADVQAAFSNDIIGTGDPVDGTRPDPRTVRLFVEGVPTAETPNQAAIRRSVGGENDGPSRQLGRFVTDVAQNEHTGMNVRVIWRRDRFLRSSDHVPFLQQGYPAARFTEPRENFAHEHQDVRVENGVQFGDLIEFCDFDYIARVTKVNLATLWSLAQGPGTPANLRIRTAALTNDTTLVWDRGPGDVAGYQVLWRETTEADWTHVIDVGNVSTTTIDLSKDNVQFGVRAVDSRGRRSPAAFPVPVS